MNRVAILCDRVLRHRKILANKRDTLISRNLNLSAINMKGLILLYEDATTGGLVYGRDTENGFYNPKITKIHVILKLVPNQIYSQGMRSYHMWEATICEKLPYVGSYHM